MGNAIENIYSIDGNFTPGTYTVKVQLYNSKATTPKPYNCRIIIDGVVVKSVSGSIFIVKDYNAIYTFTIE